MTMFRPGQHVQITEEYGYGAGLVGLRGTVIGIHSHTAVLNPDSTYVEIILHTIGENTGVYADKGF